MMARDSGRPGGIVWDDVRARVEFTGDALDIPRSAVESLIGQSDGHLNGTDDLWKFCERHGISMDWLVCGDVAALLRYSRATLLA